MAAGLFAQAGIVGRAVDGLMKHSVFSVIALSVPRCGCDFTGAQAVCNAAMIRAVSTTAGQPRTERLKLSHKLKAVQQIGNAEACHEGATRGLHPHKARGLNVYSYTGDLFIRGDLVEQVRQDWRTPDSTGGYLKSANFQC